MIKSFLLFHQSIRFFPSHINQSALLGRGFALRSSLRRPKALQKADLSHQFPLSSEKVTRAGKMDIFLLLE
jgi:hypothetical protein